MRRLALLTPLLALVAVMMLAGCAHDQPQPQPVSIESLPASVRQGFIKDFPDVKIESVERVPQKDNQGPDFYRIHFIDKDGKRQDILYNPEGYKQTMTYERKHSSGQ